ncbi:endothelin-converting enzyme 1-like isoform X2 [Dermacentor albipictus]|uniref:endothelin-converting enzyme 1-like isoform X2 n=1 Tax=Dermacentor albipictus TaxID=60249 RepID=UPI0038FC2A1A
MNKERGTPSDISVRSLPATTTPSNATTAVPVAGGRLSDHNGDEGHSHDTPKPLTLPDAVEAGSHREGSETAAEHRHAGVEDAEQKSSLEHEKSQESLQPESPRHSQGSRDRNRKKVPSGGYAEVPGIPATSPQQTADSRRELPRHHIVGLSPSVVHCSGGADMQGADVPGPSSAVHVEPARGACEVHDHATQPITASPSVETHKLIGHSNAPQSAQRELPPPLVCKISVPHFAGESKYFEDSESEQTDWLHPTSKANSWTTSSCTPKRRIGNSTLASASPAPTPDATESPAACFHATAGSSSVHQMPSFSEMREQELQSIRRRREHPYRPSADIRATKDGISVRRHHSQATPSSRFLSASLSKDDAFRTEEAERAKISWPATGTSTWSSGGSSRFPWKNTATPAVVTADLPQTAAKFVTAQSSPSPSVYLDFPDQSNASELCPEKWPPSPPPSALVESPEQRSLRSKQRFMLQPPWMKKLLYSDAQSPSFHCNTASPPTPSSWMRGSLPKTAGRRADVHPEGATPSSKQLSSRHFLSSTMQALLRKWQTTVMLCAALLLAAVGASLLLLGLLGGRGDERRRLAAAVCRTESCLEYSRRLAESVNTSLRPCEGFTRFVCDGWRRRNRLSVREEAFYSQQRRLSQLLRSVPVPLEAQSPLEAAAALFSSCEAVSRGEVDELPKVKAALLEAGILWPRMPSDSDKVDVLGTWLRASLRLHWSVVLHVFVRQTEDGTRIALRPLREFERVVEKHRGLTRSDRGAKDYFDTLRREFGSPGRPSAEEMRDTVSFADSRNVDRAYMTPLSEAMESPARSVQLDVAELFGTVPGFTEERWLAELKRYEGVSKNAVYESTRPAYVRTFLQLWKARGERETHLFLSWCIVQTAALFTNRRLLLNFYDSDSGMDMHHGAFCLGKAYLLCGSQMFGDYFDDLLSERASRVAGRMVAETREAFSRRLRQWPRRDANRTVVQDSTDVALDYFDPRLNLRLPKRTAAAFSSLGNSLVENWKSLALNRADVLDRWAAAEQIEFAEWTVLLPGRHLAVLPYALAFPSFDEGAARFMNQGGLGNHVASTLSQLFFNSYADSLDADEPSLMQCAGANASNSGDRHAAPKLASLALSTLALEASLEAYRAGGASVDSERIDGFEDYGGTAMFFVASCYALCRGGGGMNPYVGDEYDKLFSNVEGFAEALGCDPGSRTNPLDKCAFG